MRRARDVCKGICNEKILHFSCYCKYGVLVSIDDGTGPADESKRTKRVQGWSRQILGGRLLLFAILLLCEKTTFICLNMHIKHVDYLYNSINQCMIRLR